MDILKNILGKTPEEFQKKCEEMENYIKDRKVFWKKILNEMNDEEFKTSVCNQSENFVCFEFMNEKYFLGYTDEKPLIKILDEIPFSMECPRYTTGICKIKKAVEEKFINHDEEEEGF